MAGLKTEYRIILLINTYLILKNITRKETDVFREEFKTHSSEQASHKAGAALPPLLTSIAGGHDGTGRDGTGHDGTGQDTTGRDTTGRDGTGRDGLTGLWLAQLGRDSPLLSQASARSSRCHMLHGTRVPRYPSQAEWAQLQPHKSRTDKMDFSLFVSLILMLRISSISL